MKNLFAIKTSPSKKLKDSKQSRFCGLQAYVIYNLQSVNFI